MDGIIIWYTNYRLVTGKQRGIQTKKEEITLANCCNPQILTSSRLCCLAIMKIIPNPDITDISRYFPYHSGLCMG